MWPELQVQKQQRDCHPRPCLFAFLMKPSLQPLGHGRFGEGGVQTPKATEPMFSVSPTPTDEGLHVCEAGGPQGRMTMGLSVLNQNVSGNRDRWSQGAK